MSKFIIIERPENWQIDIDGVEVITPKEYIGNTFYQTSKKIKILNLCRSYAYQSLGYYVSLLSEARGHKVMPSIQTIQDLRWFAFVREESQDFDDLIQETFKKEQDDKVEFNIYFGKTKDETYQKLAAHLFSVVQAPFLKFSFVKKVKWILNQVRTLNITQIPTEDHQLFQKSLDMYFSNKRIPAISNGKVKYDLAILVNPDDNNPPSDSKAIQKFVKAAEKLNFNTELITKSDFSKIIQFDALFIRETTYVNHHTFRFAKKAASEGLIVVDDPNSILKCTNKVYLYELLKTNKIPTPFSQVLRKGSTINYKKTEFPLILKQPDGAFSKGVKKVENPDEYKVALHDMFQKSELVIAQEFLPTSFDWRIGIMDNKPLYVNKYFMARNHWQIINWDVTGEDKDGNNESIPLDEVPPKLLNLALKASALIGDGLYGIDIKEVDGKYFVIEINDNPSIDHKVEDQMLKDKLYLNIMEYFRKRM